MNFFLDDSEIEAQSQDILTRFRSLMNGVTHQEMHDYGLKYSKAVGASVVSLRVLSASYKPSHLLAHKLWVMGYRESRIMATLLDEPSKVTFEQLECWMQDIETTELLEQLSMNLLCKIPHILELMTEWIVSSSELCRCAAIQVAGRIAFLGQETDDKCFVEILTRLPKGECGGYFQKCLQRNLGKIGKSSVGLNQLIVNILQERIDCSDGWRDLANDLSCELGVDF